MDDDDKDKAPIGAIEIGGLLSDLSVDEINERIALLKEEITRLKKAAGKKSDHLSAAEAFFKN